MKPPRAQARLGSTSRLRFLTTASPGGPVKGGQPNGSLGAGNSAAAAALSDGPRTGAVVLLRPPAPGRLAAPPSKSADIAPKTAACAGLRPRHGVTDQKPPRLSGHTCATAPRHHLGESAPTPHHQARPTGDHRTAATPNQALAAINRHRTTRPTTPGADHGKDATKRRARRSRTSPLACHW